jgi:Dcp1-like decapping family
VTHPSSLLKIAPAAAMASLIGAVDKAATLAVNLSVLQRKDAAVTEILGHASHVSVYIFDTAVSRWVSAIYYDCTFTAVLLHAIAQNSFRASLKLKLMYTCVCSLVNRIAKM